MRKILIILTLVSLLLVAAGAGVYAWHNTKTDLASSAIRQPKINPNDNSYSVQLLSGSTYASGKPYDLRFVIHDQNGQVFKAFDISNQYVLMLTVIRKDLSNFQHIHPIYDDKSGAFTVPGFQFPVDGVYRLFAQFTAANAKTSDGTKSQSTPHIDVQVGNENRNLQPQDATDKFTSSSNGFDTSIFSSSDGDSIGAPLKTFTAVDVSSIPINIDKNGTAYRGLQSYRGSLGRIFAISQNLELVSANSVPETSSEQSGLLVFNLAFPTAGRYKLFMQIQSDYHVSTFDYSVTVKPVPTSNKNNSKGQTQ